MAVGPPPPPARIASQHPGWCLRHMAAQLRREADSFNARADDLESIADAHFPRSGSDDDAL